MCGTKEGNIIFYDLKAGACEDIVRDQHKSQVVGCEWFQEFGGGTGKLATIDDLGGLLIWGP